MENSFRYMWINGNWCGGSYALCSQIVRNEWGMQGSIITDNFVGSWMKPAKAILAGTDLMLSVGAKRVDDTTKATNAGKLAMKDSCKHILYAIASVQSNREVQLKDVTNNWPPVKAALIIVSCVGIIVSLGLLVFEIIKYKKTLKD